MGEESVGLHQTLASAQPQPADAAARALTAPPALLEERVGLRCCDSPIRGRRVAAGGVRSDDAAQGQRLAALGGPVLVARVAPPALVWSQHDARAHFQVGQASWMRVRRGERWVKNGQGSQAVICGRGVCVARPTPSFPSLPHPHASAHPHPHTAARNTPAHIQARKGAGCGARVDAGAGHAVLAHTANGTRGMAATGEAGVTELAGVLLPLLDGAHLVGVGDGGAVVLAADGDRGGGGRMGRG